MHNHNMYQKARFKKNLTKICVFKKLNMTILVTVGVSGFMSDQT